MAKHRGVARDEFGNSLSGASVTVYEPDTTTEATLYSDSALSVSLGNPLSAGDDGVYVFYIDPGYYDIQVAKSGYSTVTLENEVIGSVMIALSLENGHSADVYTAENTFGNTEWTGGATTFLTTVFNSNAFTVNLLTGVFTYSGPTIQAEMLILGSFYCATAADILMEVSVYKDKGGGGEELLFVAQCGTGVATYLETLAGGNIIQLDDGDTIHMIATNGDVGGETHVVRGGYISIKGLG